MSSSVIRDEIASSRRIRTPLSAKDKLTVGLSSFGGALEFFDFTIFIFLTPVIANVFFPAGQPVWIKELSAFSIFALGWLARPLGGTVIAYYGDRFGRKKLFMFTVLFMAIPTLLTGLLPSYETAGIASPLLLILLRLMQGIAIGGEVPGALTFVTEHVPRSRLGFACSLFGAMLYVGLLLGSGSTALITHYLPQDALLSWGWRLPFLAGGLVAFFVVYLRRNLSETPFFQRLKEAGAENRRFPLSVLVKQYSGAMCFTLLYAAILSILITGLFTFLPTPLQSIYKLPRDVVSQADTGAIAMLVIFGPLWGLLGDRIGVHRAFALGCAVSLITTVWFFYRLGTIDSTGAGLTPAWLVVGAACSFVCMVPALVTQVFATQIRYTGFALPYNVGLAVFTGLLPIAMTLLDRFAGRNSLCVLTVIVCVLGIAISFMLPSLIVKASKDERIQPLV